MTYFQLETIYKDEMAKQTQKCLEDKTICTPRTKTKHSSQAQKNFQQEPDYK
jgi:hypothetical protein